MNAYDFFSQPQNLFQKQYEALRMYYFEKKPAIEVAEKFGYTYRGFTTLAYNFSKKLKEGFMKNCSLKSLRKVKNQVRTAFRQKR